MRKLVLIEWAAGLKFAVCCDQFLESEIFRCFVPVPCSICINVVFVSACGPFYYAFFFPCTGAVGLVV